MFLIYMLVYAALIYAVVEHNHQIAVQESEDKILRSYFKRLERDWVENHGQNKEAIEASFDRFNISRGNHKN